MNRSKSHYKQNQTMENPGRSQDNPDDDLSALIDGLVRREEKAKPTEATSLSLVLADKGRFPETSLGDQHLPRIQELRAITATINQKVIRSAKLPRSVKFKVDYRRELNPQQLAAVATTEIPLLVIAGAGSGKTRVITYKVAYLVENGVEPSEILLLTFTRKAAEEMLTRASALLSDKSTGNVLGGTFHSFSNYVLRRYGPIIGLQRNFTIIDTEDVADIIDLLRTELGIQGKKGGPPFPRKGKVQEIISRARNLEQTIDHVVHDYFEENIPYIPELELLDRAQQKFKKASNLLDYDDLMIQLRDGLRDNLQFRSQVLGSFKYILVDEYQDTNNAQREIVELLASEHGRVTVVGDDSQSIYAFRGANFENILRFPQSFPDCGIVMLEQNYRSDQGILDFCNDVISKAQIGFPKRLFSTRSTGRRPQVKRFADGPAEAEFIVDRILEIKDNDLEFNDFAVLTRASWHSNFVQAELMKRGIPFIVVGGIKFSERRHVRDLVALIKIVLNPMDAVSWHRVLKLIEGVGTVRAKEIVDVIHKHNGAVQLSEFSNRKFYPELLTLQGVLNDIIEHRYSAARTVELLLQYYQPILRQLEDDFAARIRDLEVFAVIAGKYADLERFITDFSLDPPSNRFQDENIPLTEPDEKPMVVSTIHSAKGLEWHTVFLPFALDGLIPSVRSMETVEDLEEERRLFYVGCSRAMENLFVTMPAYVSSWDSVFTLPSRFLFDVDARHLQLADHAEPNVG